MNKFERIPKLIETLRGVWYQFSSLRLGQLIINATNVKELSELYHIEDHVLLERIKDYCKQKGTIQSGKSNKRRNESG